MKTDSREHILTDFRAARSWLRWVAYGAGEKPASRNGLGEVVERLVEMRELHPNYNVQRLFGEVVMELQQDIYETEDELRREVPA